MELCYGKQILAINPFDTIYIKIINQPKFTNIHKKDPNIPIKREMNFGTNAMGFQGINCPSYFFFNPKNNSNNFIIALCNYQISRLNLPFL